MPSNINILQTYKRRKLRFLYSGRWYEEIFYTKDYSEIPYSENLPNKIIKCKFKQLINSNQVAQFSEEPIHVERTIDITTRGTEVRICNL